MCDIEIFGKKSLFDHIKKIHDVKKQDCEECGKVFNTHKSLKKHAKNIHTKTSLDIC